MRPSLNLLRERGGARLQPVNLEVDYGAKDETESLGGQSSLGI
jgi:hypothetical protein